MGKGIEGVPARPAEGGTRKQVDSLSLSLSPPDFEGETRLDTNIKGGVNPLIVG